MLYCVSYTSGIVGVFSSLEKIKEIVYNKYQSIPFITQVFKNSNNPSYVNDKHIVWCILYKDTEFIANLSDNKNEAINIKNIFNILGKSYDDDITYWELEVDTISSSTISILDSIQQIYGETEICIDSTSNIIYYI